MLKNAPRIISLVPSWTETFLSLGLSVVGRTRYCIHPENSVSSIPCVGGTKDLDWPKLLQLSPDIVVLDRQENTKEMAAKLSAAGITYFDTNVTDFRSLFFECKKMADLFQCQNFNNLVERYDTALKNLNLKGLIQNIILAGDAKNFPIGEAFNYVIWKKPFMVIGKNTFIAENLKLIGLEVQHEEKYSEITEEELKKTFCLFSSEPYPFGKYYLEMQKKGFRGLVVDGEKLSWFGIRNLNFLESNGQ